MVARVFAFFHGVADAFVKFEAYAGIDRVFFLFAAAAEHGQRDAELLALRGGDVAVGAGGDIGVRARAGQAAVVVDHARVAALQRDSLLEFFFGLAAGDQFLSEARPSSTDGVRSPRKNIQAESSMLRSRRSAGPRPLRTSIDSMTSEEWPAARPSG